MNMALQKKDRDSNLVSPKDACPTCGQRDADHLVWIDDDTVQCAACGTRYQPLAKQKGDDDAHVRS